MRTAACVLASAVAMGTTGSVTAEELPSREEMWRIIQQQQQKIDALEQKQQETARKANEADEKAEAAVEAAETGSGYDAAGAGWAARTRIGGYGELHYNNWDGKGGASDKDEVDFHRFVLFFGHEFNDRLRFFSELEIEHALSGDGAPGEVELEQAYIEYDLNDHHRLAGGLQLLPVGILNEVHEPVTFYGVERNPVENKIIPTTWWEAAATVRGELAPEAVPGLSYDLVLHSGLETPVTGGSAFLIRSGRKKVAKAPAEDGAITARLKWTGMPGVEVAGSFQYQNDLTQGVQDIGATLFEVHTDIERGPWGLRALYARWDLDDGAPGVGPATGPSPGRDEQYGFYIEPSYKIALSAIPGEIGAFYRFNQWDNNAGDSGSATRKRQHQIGLNYWPHPDVVLKVDLQQEDNADGKDQDGFNLGIGYQF